MVPKIVYLDPKKFFEENESLEYIHIFSPSYQFHSSFLFGKEPVFIVTEMIQ